MIIIHLTITDGAKEENRTIILVFKYGIIPFSSAFEVRGYNLYLYYGIIYLF